MVQPLNEVEFAPLALPRWEVALFFADLARYAPPVSTVLIVQPDPEVGDGWSLAVEACGHAVLKASATADGLERVREGGIDLIVVDGAAAAETSLAAFVAELDRLPDAPPFVLISSSPRAPEISARLGAAAFLPKPCTQDDLGGVVARLATGTVRPPPG